ncbi:MAG: phosphoribosyl-ATP diphosphatase [Gammaproteobacteria bacterium]|nr:phosphoribosyl-ATP diphosphatase [Gammaproteobacteria bacterium]
MAADNIEFLNTLEATIRQRIALSPDGSYTAKLANSGIRRVAQKTGEEAIEVALAAVAQDRQELRNESADLLYHLLVLLALSDISLPEVVEVLRSRHAPA